ncbi:MAG TPA: hypothetical protein PLY36_10015 [Spirochaetota bacterium]|nr:hypothetical protein [Spirochaetota bacterium]
MKQFTFRFRSIMVNHVEKVIPGTVFSKMVLEMDDTAVEEHTLILTLKDILKDSAWVTQFILTLMIAAAVSGILFAGAYVGFGRTMESSAWNIIKLIFLIADIIVIIPVWIFLAAKVSIGNKKRELVVQKRGAGNWRIVDESEWEKFNRLLMIAKNRRESEKLIK